MLELFGLFPHRAEQLVESNHQEAGRDDEGDPVEADHGEGGDGEGQTVEDDGDHREIFSLPVAWPRSARGRPDRAP